MRTDPDTRRLAVEALGEAPTRLEYERVSRRMGVPEGTLRTWIHRARKENGTSPKRETKHGETETRGTDPHEKRGDARLEIEPVACDPRVTHRQAEACAMLAAGKTWREVQATLDVSSSALTHWHREPGFASYLRELRDMNLAIVRTGMNGVGQSAVEAVRETVEGGPDIPPATRLSAAFGTLDRIGVGPKSTLEVEATVHATQDLDLTTPEGEEQVLQLLVSLPMATLDKARARKMAMDTPDVEVTER
jgi:transposase-like protein